MLDDERARSGILVAYAIDPALAVLLFSDQNAVAGDHAFENAGCFLLPRIDKHAEIGAVRDEPFLRGLQRFDETFAGERVAVDDRERAAVEGEPARVRHPDGAQRPAGARCAVPE